MFTFESRRKLHIDCVHSCRSGTHCVPAWRPGSVPASGHELQDVAIKTFGRRVTRHRGRRRVLSCRTMVFDGTDTKLEVSGVRGGQLDDDWHHVTRTISTNYNTRRVATSQLVVARLRRVPRVSTHPAFPAVHLPLSLNITAMRCEATLALIHIRLNQFSSFGTASRNKVKHEAEKPCPAAIMCMYTLEIFDKRYSRSPIQFHMQ